MRTCWKGESARTACVFQHFHFLIANSRAAYTESHVSVLIHDVGNALVPTIWAPESCHPCSLRRRIEDFGLEGFGGLTLKDRDAYTRKIVER